jgi:hypothetical protein|tara:strand:- start:331 stop:699 length:369 start_codon:yes stop_codon:yes gene_type:complete
MSKSEFTKTELAAVKRVNEIIAKAYIEMLETSPDEEKEQMMVTELSIVFANEAIHMLSLATATDVKNAQEAGESEENTNKMRVAVFEAALNMVSKAFGFHIITKCMSNDDYEVIKAYRDGAQ